MTIHLLWYLFMSVTMVCLGYYFYQSSVYLIILSFLAGILSWSFIEYLMHRFFFHVILDSKLLRKIYYALHGVHHDYPLDEKRTLMPPLPGLIFALIYLGIFYLILGHIAFYFVGGVAIGYLTYSSLHHAIHLYKAPKILQKLWTHHLLHHYQEPDKAFGVTSTLWDRIFMTMPKGSASKKTSSSQF